MYLFIGDCVFIGSCVFLWKKMRRKNHQHKPTAKKYEYTVPGQVHRGYIHPGKPYIPPNWWTLWDCVYPLSTPRERIYSFVL